MNEDIVKYIGEDSPGYCFENLVGRGFWKTILASYWNTEEMDDALFIEPVQSVLLYGPYGSGKNTLLEAMAGEMIQGGYNYLYINLLTIPKEKIASVFKYIYTEYKKKGPLFLRIYHLERLQDIRLLQKLLQWAEERENPMVIAASVEDEDDLPKDIRKMFYAYYIGLPSEEDRKAYFMEELENLFNNASSQGMKKLVQDTEGYNYVQMASVVQCIKMRVKYSMLKEGKTINMAMDYLNDSVIQEVLKNTELPKKKSSESMDLSALVQAISNIQPAQVQFEKKTEVVKPQRRDPLAGLHPSKIFD